MNYLNKHSLYHSEYERNEILIFKELIDKKILFETLIYYFCPSLKENYLLKAFLVL